MSLEPADPIVPDTKDWTWTTQRPCAECGFDASAVTPDQLPTLVRALTRPWALVLGDEEAAAVGLRDRPDPSTWSPLEYACHVHDVLDVFAGRFALILAKEDPTLPNWDQDEAAVAGAYAAQDPAEVGAGISTRTDALVEQLGRYDSGDWDRSTQRSDGASFTALTLGRYLVHDLAHHLHDVGAGSAGAPTGRRGV
ncbi:DinB family protein [Ornithinimicrobium cryptoxanthini]|uniref:DinB family protein n=1 Tax=Ornithinimicrobium cryptoxanthini TaxID=2934161 RepID=UPI002119ABE1|nr:DinB family protein [Ornithinimicrobium cryptoxanthini]